MAAMLIALVGVVAFAAAGGLVRMGDQRGRVVVLTA